MAASPAKLRIVFAGVIVLMAVEMIREGWSA
jgi:hypothetical protein